MFGSLCFRYKEGRVILERALVQEGNSRIYRTVDLASSGVPSSFLHNIILPAVLWIVEPLRFIAVPVPFPPLEKFRFQIRNRIQTILSKVIKKIGQNFNVRSKALFPRKLPFHF